MTLRESGIEVREITERLEHSLRYSTEFAEAPWYWSVRYYYDGKAYSASGCAATESEARTARDKATYVAQGEAVHDTECPTHGSTFVVEGCETCPRRVA